MSEAAKALSDVRMQIDTALPTARRVQRRHGGKSTLWGASHGRGTPRPLQSRAVQARRLEELAWHWFPCETNASRRRNFIKIESEPSLDAEW